MAGEISPDMTFCEGSQNGEIWVQMDADGLQWVGLDEYITIKAKNQTKPPQIDDQDMILYCVITARKHQVGRDSLCVFTGDYGKEWRGSTRFAVKYECVCKNTAAQIYQTTP